MISIKEFDYSASSLDSTLRSISYWQYSTNWPVVYIMHNSTDAYVGETLDGIRRTRQHLEEKSDTQYKMICMMTDKNFNKSVALDMESFLIKYMSADGKFRLHNGNAGVADHNYFNRDVYQDEFKYAWSELINKGLANHTIDQIENSDLFKYSPYKSLTADQDDALIDILHVIQENLNTRSDRKLILVDGEAGTGKTILAVYLIKLLTELSGGDLTGYQTEDAIDKIDFLKAFAKKNKHLKVGFVVPMQSLRESLKNVFKTISGLSEKMILKPSEVTDDYYDLLIVDEAHRLRRRAYLSQYPAFDNINRKLCLDNEGTELDWIIKSSRMQLIFYDSDQSIRPSDIERSCFESMTNKYKCKEFKLKSQLRCKGGNDYIDYVKSVIYENQTRRHKGFADYDLRVFDDPNEMIKAIRQKNDEFGPCRVVAGYGWKWQTKSDKTAYDIFFDGNGYRWNTHSTDWINSADAVNEIGCIHTVQGYDLNIAGVVFGPEITYDKIKKEIVIDRSNYHDQLGKTKNPKELKQFIQNIYITLMTRGIRGTYIYACNPELHAYLKEFF